MSNPPVGPRLDLLQLGRLRVSLIEQPYERWSTGKVLFDLLFNDAFDNPNQNHDPVKAQQQTNSSTEGAGHTQPFWIPAKHTAEQPVQRVAIRNGTACTAAGIGAVVPLGDRNKRREDEQDQHRATQDHRDITAEKTPWLLGHLQRKIRGQCHNVDRWNLGQLLNQQIRPSPYPRLTARYPPLESGRHWCAH
jgi:hypothetical protein